jgi:hypothetical protein
MSDWTNLVYKESETDFEYGFLAFKTSWSRFPQAVSYIERNLYPVRNKFVAAWTNRFRHLGSTSTSRVEGLHAQIKQYIETSKGNLLAVNKALKLAIETQFNGINILVEQQKIANYARFGSFFRHVKNKISYYSLDMVLKQMDLDRPLKECTGSFSQVYGVPCGHILDQKMMFNEKLEINDFCPQWRLDITNINVDESHNFHTQISRLQSLVEAGGSNVGHALARQLEQIANYTLIQNPAVVVSGRGRPVGAANTVRRDPSAFERVEAASDKAEFERNCSTLCTALQVYLESHTYMDIQSASQAEGVTLIGFSQSMCSLMKKGKSCVKNPQTVEWLINFLNNKI